MDRFFQGALAGFVIGILIWPLALQEPTKMPVLAHCFGKTFMAYTEAGRLYVLGYDNKIKGLGNCDWQPIDSPPAPQAD